MTKDFQKELLEKVKPGMKPSDIKKLSQKPSKTPLSPPPMSISKSDEGYESDKSDKSVPVAPLPNSLPAQINSLQKQLQLYKDFREGDLKVKEDLKESISKLQTENKLLKEKVSRLEKPDKTTEENPIEVKTLLELLCLFK